MTENIVFGVLQAMGWLSPMDVQNIMLARIQSQLGEIKAGIDQLTLKEVYAAFDAIEDAMVADNAQTVERRLQFAETGLMNNTRLDLEEETGDIPNPELVATAHHGLAFITILRGDQVTSVRHLLKSYLVDPRQARVDLSPGVYEAIFEPYMGEILDDYSEKYAWIEEYDFENERNWAAFWWKVAAWGGGISLSAILRHAGYAVLTEGLKHADRVKKDIKGFRKEALEELEEAANVLIDDRCKEVAQELLDDCSRRAGRGTADRPASMKKRRASSRK